MQALFPTFSRSRAAQTAVMFGQSAPTQAGLSLRFAGEPEGDSFTLSASAVDKLRRLQTRQTQSFREEFQRVIDDAKAYLEGYLRTHDPARSAVVLDLDNTLFDNSGKAILDVLSPRKTHKELYTDWFQRAESPAIPETLAFVHWLKQKGVPVFFVTFRKGPDFYDATVRNLQRIGLQPGDYAGLMLNDVRTRTANQYKIAAQQEIQAQGYDIALVMGDRQSDIDGALGKAFKLPNPL